MKKTHIQFKTALLLIALTLSTSCSNGKQSTNLSASDRHFRTAEIHEREAKLYREQGVDRMADYYNEEAKKERNKAFNSCDLFDITLSIITLGFFDC